MKLKIYLSFIMATVILFSCNFCMSADYTAEEITKIKKRITEIKNNTSDEEKTNEIFVSAIDPESGEQIIKQALHGFNYEIVKQFKLTGSYLVSLSSVEEADRAVDKLNARKDIKYAEPNYRISLAGPPVPVPSDWAKEYVEKAEALNIKDKWALDYVNPITREKFCELIYNLLNVTGTLELSEGENKFTDTENEKIIALCNMEIISGKTETEFAPHDNLTREEAAAILYRTALRSFDGAAVTSQWITFKDYDEMSDWSVNDIQVIYKWGIMNGVGNVENIPLFAPKDTLTAEQAVTAIVRMYDRIR